MSLQRRLREVELQEAIAAATRTVQRPYGPLYLVWRPLRSAPPAELTVCLMALTVSTSADGHRQQALQTNGDPVGRSHPAEVRPLCVDRQSTHGESQAARNGIRSCPRPGPTAIGQVLPAPSYDLPPAPCGCRPPRWRSSPLCASSSSTPSRPNPCSRSSVAAVPRVPWG